MGLELSHDDRAMLEGARGDAARLAMRILVEMAGVWEAERLIDITSAHIDSCLYHGRAGLDFAERLVEGGAQVVVPTTLNVSSLDLLHPELVRLDAETTADARRLMDAYVAMGCRTTWTCAPYQLPDRPAFGKHIAWAESNAIVFANSVLGARTNRYGDFIDICAAITGRAPEAGLHLAANRHARVVFRLEAIPDRLLRDEIVPTLVGHVVGERAGTAVPAIVGLPQDTDEDRLKALGAAAASSGAVAMFHAVGITPEAPTLEAALGGRRAEREIVVTAEDLRTARDALDHGRHRADRRGERRHAAPVDQRARRASLRAWTSAPFGAVLREHRARRGRGRRTAWLPGTAPPRGRLDRDRHLHLHRADPARRPWPGDDELGEVGVVRPREPWVRRGVRLDGRMRALGRARQGVARSRPLG